MSTILRLIPACIAVAVWTDSAWAQAALYFVHPDHLNTPRLVANAAGTTVWKWAQQEPFGDNIADENPSGLGTFDLPLRLPGQRYDRETGLHYNYFRDYEPSFGRYAESDPIGLRGGINSYAYVGGLPLTYSDATGLWFPETHRMMTEDALARTSCKVDGLPAKTAGVDSEPFSQAAANAKWHHMAVGASNDHEAQSRTAAEAAYNAYLADQRRSCDLKGLAHALHAIQDGFSPSHKDFQPWRGMADTSYRDLLKHGVGDAFPSVFEWANSVAASAAEIQAFMARCPCKCK